MNDDFDLGRFDDIGDPYGDPADSRARPAPPLRAATVAALARPSPSRSQVQRARVAALGAALVFEMAWIVFCRMRRLHANAYTEPMGAVVLNLAIPLVAAGLVLGAASNRGSRGLGLRASWIGGLALGAPLLFALATMVSAPPDAGDGLFWSHSLSCMAATLLLAAIPFGLALATFRRAFVVSAGWRTAALGVASGALAAATLSLSCPVGTMGHVLVGHGAILLVAGLAGAAIARTRLVRG